MKTVLETELGIIRKLSGGLAHDLKSPLNALTLNLELLRRSLELDRDEQAERRRRWVAILDDELRRLREGLERWMRLVVTPGFRGAAEPAPFDLGELRDEVAALVRPQAGYQGVGLALGTGASPLPTQGCRHAVRLAALQLAVGSLEAAGAGGVLRLETARSEGCAVLRVSLDGAAGTEGNGAVIAAALIEGSGGTAKDVRGGCEIHLPMSGPGG